jgi:hypothetical protein
MSSEINIYIKNRINQLIINYNNDLRKLTITLNNNIAMIKISKQRLYVKNILINSLINNYNKTVNSLKNTFIQNKLNVQKFVPGRIDINKKKYALLIGINYTGTSNELYGCINDANSIKDFIINKNFDNIILMTDLTEKKATRNNIINEFKSLLKLALPGDFIFFFYSGHGSYTLDRNGDENGVYDQLIVPCDLNMIIDDELKNIIQNNLKKDVTLFAMFDSCFSGSVLDLKYNFMDSLNYDNYSENNKELETTGHVFMISGCTDNQTSTETEINDKTYGAMTWSFLESFKQTTDYTWRELIKKMRDSLKDENFNQIPQFSCGLFENIDEKVFFTSKS